MSDGSGSQKAVDGPASLLLGSGGKLLSSPSGRGLLQMGKLSGSLGGNPLESMLGRTPVGERPEVDLGGTWMHGWESQQQQEERWLSCRAIRIAKGGSFQRKVMAFRSCFFSATSARSRTCKREEIIKLARAVKPHTNILPLSKDLVESVAAALKESGMKSRAQYLVELKLLHIEAGYEVDSWLKRTLDLCKKGLERARGPPLRAPQGVWKTLMPSGGQRHARHA